MTPDAVSKNTVPTDALPVQQCEPCGEVFVAAERKCPLCGSPFTRRLEEGYEDLPLPRFGGSGDDADDRPSSSPEPRPEI